MDLKPVTEMTLAEKIGQLLTIPVEGTHATRDMVDLIETYRIGGVIIYRENAENAVQVRELTANLDKQVNVPWPLFFAADQEGGARIVIKRGVAIPPAAMALGGLGDRSVVYEVTRRVARDLREMGINWIFAPVADIQTNPLNPIINARSFAEEPTTVSACVRAAVHGFQSEGIMACAKHFPGHGDTSTDSHLTLPLIEHERSRLERIEWVPFVSAIQAGVGSIMTAHIAVPRLDPTGVPATFSKPLLTDILRDSLQFNGLIVSDATTMRAITDHFSLREAGARAIAAGVDVVLATGTPDQVVETWEGIYHAVRDGDIPESVIDRAVMRIREHKEKWVVPVRAFLRGKSGAPWRVRTEAERNADHAWVDAIAAQTSAVAWGGDSLPIDLGGDPLLVVAPSRLGSPLSNTQPLNDLVQLAREHYSPVLAYPMDPDLTAEQIQEVRRMASQAGAVVVATCSRGGLPVAQRIMVEALRSAARRLIVVALWNPYHLLDLCSADVAILSYGYRTSMLKGVVNLLMATGRTRGSVPSSLRR